MNIKFYHTFHTNSTSSHPQIQNEWCFYGHSSCACKDMRSHTNHTGKASPLYVCLYVPVTRVNVKVKVIPQQAEVAQGVPGRLSPLIFLTFGTTRVVGHQPYAPAAFTPGEIPGTHFQGLSRPQDTWFRQGEPRKISPVTLPGIDPGTVWLVAQCLNHYATPGPPL
jgi:hypothetical protein